MPVRVRQGRSASRLRTGARVGADVHLGHRSTVTMLCDRAKFCHHRPVSAEYVRRRLWGPRPDVARLCRNLEPVLGGACPGGCKSGSIPIPGGSWPVGSFQAAS